jgi:thiamine pyrophosphate-dependent acetolactate synthase large subunit-like protein
MTMTHQQALEVVAKHRGERIVVTTMTSVAVWAKLSNSPLGLGLALAQPERGVIVLNGDGCMLMSLGSLVTLANSPANVYLLIMDNGLYEVTGGQPTAGSGRVDFAGMARAAGIGRTYTFDTADGWSKGAAEALSGPGPVAIWLKIEGRLGQQTPAPPRPMKEQIAQLQGALQRTTNS